MYVVVGVERAGAYSPYFTIKNFDRYNHEKYSRNECVFSEKIKYTREGTRALMLGKDSKKKEERRWDVENVRKMNVCACVCVFGNDGVFQCYSSHRISKLYIFGVFCCRE